MNMDYKRLGYFAGIGLGIIVVTAFIFSQIIFPIVLGRTPKVEVPELTGKSLTLAKRILSEEKLHLVVKDSLFSEIDPIDAVIEQIPPAGDKIRQDGTVYLIVSKGSATVEVPYIIGKSFQEAFITLRNSNLHSVVADSTYSDLYPVNCVVRSIPFSGDKVSKQSTVKLILSRGNMPVPDSLSTEQPIYPY
ncbi:MAG: PASTA domain-containing protein [Candidatus Cloacimonas sp.]|jgi:serine/threonine-protein kinase|nr:PASTA domain-containing protein [Candidatus Cloacimonas sp.]